MPSGWIVKVTAVSAAGPTEEIFVVACGDEAQALELVWKHVAKDSQIEPVGPASQNLIAALDVAPGSLKKA